jgi:hypothetical protein
MEYGCGYDCALAMVATKANPRPASATGKRVIGNLRPKRWSTAAKRQGILGCSVGNSAQRKAVWKRLASPIATGFIGITGQSTQLENVIPAAETAKSVAVGRIVGRLGKITRSELHK